MKGAGAMARNKYPEETVARILDAHEEADTDRLREAVFGKGI